MKIIFLKILGILDKDQKQKYFKSLVFMFLNSILELFTIGIILPLLAIAAVPDLSVQLKNGGKILTLLMRSFHGPVLALGVIVLLLFILKNSAGYYLYAYYNKFVYSIATKLSGRKLEEYYNISYMDFQAVDSAEKIRDICYLPIEFAHHILLGSIIIISESMVALMFISWMLVFQLNIFMMVIGAMLPFVIVSWRISARYLKSSKNTIQSMNPLSLNKLANALSGMPEAKIYGKEDYFKGEYLQSQEKLNYQLGRLNTAVAIPGGLSELFPGAAIFLILLIFEGAGGKIEAYSLYVLGLFAAFAYRIIPSANKILNAVVHMRTYSFTIDRMPVNIMPGDMKSVESLRRDIPQMQFNSEIEMQGISFAYPGLKTVLLNDLSFCIKRSDIIGLVGRTGSGKTSLVRILLQIARQNSGTILIDGKSLREEEVLSWQRLFAYIPQDAAVLSDSVSANVAFGVPEYLIDEEKINNALNGAGLGKFVSQLPDGIRTMIGERGSNISGGQRQRLLIARALYRDAKILIFDEAMSELDITSEQEVLRTISRLNLEGKTVLIVSHHIGALSGCNKIYSLRHGKLQEISLSDMERVRKN
jgi:ATP-binding cassette, subfamily B, bacterial PglK